MNTRLADTGFAAPPDLVEIMLKAERMGIAPRRVAAALDVPATLLRQIEQILAQRAPGQRL